MPLLSAYGATATDYSYYSKSPFSAVSRRETYIYQAQGEKRTIFYRESGSFFY